MSKKINAGITSGTKSKGTASPLICTNISTSRVPYARTFQNFHLVWLDSSIDEVNNDDSINTMIQLRQIVNAVTTFTHVDECIDFMSDIEDEKIFMICSGEFGQTTVPMVHNMAQINCIYIFCKHKHWANKWSKVKGIYTDITLIRQSLKHVAQDSDRNSVSIIVSSR